MAHVEEYRDADGNLIVRERRSGGGFLLGLVLVTLAGLAIAWFLGLISFSTSGDLEAPKVSISGGEVPKLDMHTADIDVGTRQETVAVPTVKVTPADEKAN